MGIKDQVASDPTASKPAGAAKSSLICRSRRGGSDIRRAIERNQAQMLVSMHTRISSVPVLTPASRLPGWRCGCRKPPLPIDPEPLCGGCGPPNSGFVDGKGEIGHGPVPAWETLLEQLRHRLGGCGPVHHPAACWRRPADLGCQAPTPTIRQWPGLDLDLGSGQPPEKPWSGEVGGADRIPVAPPP